MLVKKSFRTSSVPEGSDLSKATLVRGTLVLSSGVVEGLVASSRFSFPEVAALGCVWVW